MGGASLKTGNLDFDARVPIPFSIFPSSYRSDAQKNQQTFTETRYEEELSFPAGTQRVGRDDQYSAVEQARLRGHRDHRDQYKREEVRVEDRYRPSRQEDIKYSYERDEHRPNQEYSSRTEVDIELPGRRRSYETELDTVERQYRTRFQPNYQEKVKIEETIDYPRHHHQQPSFQEETRFEETVEPTRFARPSYQEEVRVEETVDYPRHHHHKSLFRDDEGHHRGFRNAVSHAAEHAVEKLSHAAEKVSDKFAHGAEHFTQSTERIMSPSGKHYHREEDVVVTERGFERPAHHAPLPDFVGHRPSTHTITIPTHHIRIGDILILQGRPCQVIKITTSSATGQHRYLGVDLFTRQLHEESSTISNPSPSVIVQTMLGPVFKQYRVLDISNGTVTAMTETGDVKQALPVLDQSSLYSRLAEAFDTGRGSVRVLVLSDGGRELAVDMKIIHGSRL